MPISRPLTATILSAGVLASAGIAHAQSDLPGCADPQVKEMVIEIVVENIEQHIRGMETWQIRANELNWQLDSFSLKYITLVDVNEHTGALTCQTTLHGKRDKKYSDDIGTNWQGTMEDLERVGYWEYHDISVFNYTVAESAEDPEFIIVSVVY